MKEWQVVVAGSGGQGLMLAGSILSRTATQKEERYATQRNFYGPEKRGGFACSEIKISDHEIMFPSVEKADVMILLHQAAVQEYRNKIAEKTMVIYDSSCVDTSTLGCRNEQNCGIPLSDMARSLHTIQSLNIIALGALVAATGIVDKTHMQELIQETFPKKAEVNLKAFQMGIDGVRSYVDSKK